MVFRKLTRDTIGKPTYITNNQDIITTGLRNILKLKTDHHSKELSYKIILKKMTTQGQLKHIKKDSAIHNKFCVTCGEDRHFDNPMHYYLLCLPARIIMEVAAKQVEQECLYPHIVKRKKNKRSRQQNPDGKTANRYAVAMHLHEPTSRIQLRKK